MVDRLKGKVAVVTGAASNIGQATALSFAKEGALVVGVDLDEAGLRTTRDTAKANSVSIDTIAHDLTSEAGAEEVMAFAASRHGGIDILVTAAAFTEFAAVSGMTLNQWQKTMRGELDIVFLPVRAAWPHMVKRRGGAIVNFGSIAGWLATKNVGTVAHAAGKAGVVAMTRQIAHEGAPHHIRANTISPGTMYTPMAQAAFDAMPGFEESVRAKTMLDRLGSPQDIAWAAVFLASDEASWVTGADFAIDGGARAW